MDQLPSDAVAGMDEQGAQGEKGKRGDDEHDVEHRCSPVEISDVITLRPAGIKAPRGFA
ncbi:hypothetical protein [Paramagnetospirillum kuznetsovii]|uniref:hypothetical protein n=1 Tax=Paramagnetospirillum kuznetsovii TaxID=2053833 RepID=UPI001374B1C3|nr:hypothetical protein [Paramagnetospirillum kuznetsovii]